MNDLRKHFLRDSAGKLSELIKLLSRENILSDADRDHILRTLHTIKGTAQTFGLEDAGRLAHEIESGFQTAVANKELIGELISLRKGLETGEFFETRNPRRSVIVKDFADHNLPALPHQYLSRLSASELASLERGISDRTYFEIYRGEFEISAFANELPKRRKILESFGEIIAAFPSFTPASAGSIAFDFLLKSRKDDSAEGKKEVAMKRDEIIRAGFSLIHSTALNSIEEMLQILKLDGEKLARLAGKSIKFRTLAAVELIGDEKFRALFSALVHLIRNSIDHAFENSGEVTIDLSKSGGDLKILFSDDGIGINAAQLIASARELKIIAENEAITDSAALQLIFEPGFTTAKSVTETSGRGFGLNAVREIVNNSGGTISVQSEPGNGTRFEIILPVQ
ncbi:MAG: Hpt domain-containing protein [Pyrinomonadaceae bacterium]|nr:Hpt domain-containing protein [Pyrinomonadaceae bacterium]